MYLNACIDEYLYIAVIVTLMVYFLYKVKYVAVIQPNIKMFCLKVLYVAVIPSTKNVLFN